MAEEGDGGVEEVRGEMVGRKMKTRGHIVWGKRGEVERRGESIGGTREVSLHEARREEGEGRRGSGEGEKWRQLAGRKKPGDD